MFAIDLYPPLKDKMTLPISELRDQVVNTAGQGRLVLKNQNNQSKHVSTCNQYQKAMQGGYMAKSSDAASMISFYMLWCGSLNWMEKAKAAKNSYLKNFSLVQDYPKLPSSLFYSPIGHKHQAISLLEIYPDITIQSIHDNSIVLSSKSHHHTIVITLLAKADFNHDGKQDILLSIAEYSTKGRYTQYGVYPITKLSDTARFQKL